MSSGVQVAVLQPRGLRRVRDVSDLMSAERPLVRLAAFGGLALYGVLRWGTLLTPAPIWRLFGLLALAVGVAGPGRALARRSRTLAGLLAVAAVLATFALSGVPLGWVLHLRVALTARGIGQGLSALPQALVPYSGINHWLRAVATLGAGLLLGGGAVILCLAPRGVSQSWRMAAALPLLVLGVLPSTLVRPGLAYLHGLIVFALLAAFLWGERIRGYDIPLAVGLAGLAGVTAMLVAPALDRHRPWLDYEALTGQLAPANLERFDWTQRYGPLNWPRTGTEILDVKASRPDYWKAQDLNVFDGRGWTAGPAPYVNALPAPDPAALRRWSQTIEVTLRGIQSSDVIAAGFAAAPRRLNQHVTAGSDAGTWTSPAMLEPGASYRIATYSPRPPPPALAAAGSSYPNDLLAAYRSMLLPVGAGNANALVFPPFHAPGTPESIVGVSAIDGAALVTRSPYARAYRLARRLAGESATPYGFVAAVLAYLRRGFRYDENPPTVRYPLETFLFSDKRGYCQQFSGAMALLLRMGGLPARVAAGFTTGIYDRSNHQWVVSDLDAHAWVEVWFPHYGWVRFDPTPASAPARAATARVTPANGAGGPAAALRHSRVPDAASAAAQPQRGVRRGNGSWPWVLSLPAVAMLLIAVAALARRPGRRSGEDPQLAELERALARCGRPAAGGLTLAALERRMGGAPEAAAYIRGLRLARFSGRPVSATAAQRRALRRQLRAGLGAVGWLRAWWALPPALPVRGPRRTRPGGHKLLSDG